MGYRLAKLPPVASHGAAACDGCTVSLSTNAGVLSFSCFGNGILRLQLGAAQSDHGVLLPVPQLPVSLKRADRADIVSCGSLSLRIEHEPLRFTLQDGTRELLTPPSDAGFTHDYRISPVASGHSAGQLAFDLADRTQVYGLGEHWAKLDLRGSLVDGWNTDSLGGNGAASYKNVPFCWSPDGWGLFCNSPGPVRHAVGFPHVSHRSYVMQTSAPLDVFLIAGQTPQELIASYHHLTGLPGEVPDWAFKPWLSKAYYRTSAELLEAATAMRAKNMPCSVVVLDGRTWQDTDTRFTFAWDKSRYPDPAKVIAELKELDYRICLWIYPLCSLRAPDFAKFEEEGFFLKDEHGKTYVYHWDQQPFGKVLTPLPSSALYDFTNSKMKNWWMESCAQLVDMGVDALKTDFGEQVPADAIASDGTTGNHLHNHYSFLYNQATWEGMSKEGAPILLGRSASAGSQRYPGHWVGDSQADWGGLRSAVRGALNWSLSGAGYTGSDIGGFYGAKPSEELYLRWLQFGVLSPLCRFHGIGPRAPYEYGGQVEEIARRWLDLRSWLQPYLTACASEAKSLGAPVMRAMPYCFPKVRQLLLYDMQYMLGPDLLVAPITEAGGRIEIFLPPGRWNDVHHNEQLEGGQVIGYQCNLHEYPLFVNAKASLDLTQIKSRLGL